MKKMRYISLVGLLLVSFVGCLNFGVDKSKSLDLSKIKIDKDTRSTVVLGGGIAGLTSAIYLARAGYKPVVIEGPVPGGSIMSSHSVKNWPGDLDISGKDLLARVRSQAIENGVEILSQEVRSVDFSKWPYIVRLKNVADGKKEKDLKALSCIIALGAEPRKLNVPGEREYFGKGVSTCAICDGAFYKDKVVAVIGGGDSAVLEASFLSNIASKVLLVVRKDQLRATSVLKDELLAKKNVEVLYNTQISKIEGDGKKLTKILVSNSKEKADKSIAIDGLFLAIGAIPNTLLFKNQLELDSNKYIKLHDYQQTSKAGVFAVGDITDFKFKQLVIASGQGATGAIQAGEFLENIGFDVKAFIKESKQDISKEEKTESIVSKKSNEESVVDSSKKNLDLKGLISLDNQEHFEELLNNTNRPILIDFYAGYCGPCRMMAPVFLMLAEDLKDEAIFLKIDVTQAKYSGIVGRYNIRSIPTFIFLNSDGLEVNRVIGLVDYEKLKSNLENLY